MRFENWYGNIQIDDGTASVPRILLVQGGGLNYAVSSSTPASWPPYAKFEIDGETFGLHSVSTTGGGSLALTSGLLNVLGCECSTSVSHLEISGGTLDINFAALHSAATTWTGGTITGNGFFYNDGVLTISGDNPKYLLANLENGPGHEID